MISSSACPHIYTLMAICYSVRPTLSDKIYNLPMYLLSPCKSHNLGIE